MAREIEKVVLAGHSSHRLDWLGRLIAHAGLGVGREVTWLPPYGPVILAGDTYGTVILSTQPVGSPVVEVPDVLLASNAEAFGKFNHRLKAGGLLLYDATEIRATDSRLRDDVRSIGVPVAELAPPEAGLHTGALALVGAFVACSKLVTLEALLESIKELLKLDEGPAGAELKVCRKAVERGAAFVRDKKYMFSRYQFSIFRQ